MHNEVIKRRFPNLYGANLLRSPAELIRAGVKGQRPEAVALRSILFENVAFDNVHANNLLASVLGEGQKTDISLVPKIEQDGLVTYRIIDGFHRVGAMRNKAIVDEDFWDYQWKSSVLYGINDAQLAEERIMASIPRSVWIPRTVGWVEDFYHHSKWPEMGISASQTFGLCAPGTRFNSQHGLSQNSFDELRKLAYEKCRLWSIKAVRLSEILGVAESADPELVANIRSGYEDDNSVQFSTLAIIAGYFSGEENFGNQRAVLRYSREKKLSDQRIKILISDISNRLRPDLDPEKAFLRIRDYDLSRLTTISPGTGNGGYHEGNQALETIIDEKDAVIELLRKQLENAKILNAPWWKQDIIDLTPQERKIAELLFEELLDIEEVGIEMGRKTTLQILVLLRSGSAKYKAHRVQQDERAAFQANRTKRGRPSGASLALEDERFRKVIQGIV